MSNIKSGEVQNTLDYEGFRTDMINGLKTKIPEYSDFSSTDFGIALIELTAAMLDKLSYEREKSIEEMDLQTSKERNNIRKITKTLGYTMSEDTPAHFKQVFEITPQPKDIVIPKGYIVATQTDGTSPTIKYELDEDLVIKANDTGLEKDESGEYKYLVPITQGYTITETLGTGTDKPDQSFTLNNRPVLQDSVRIFVNNGIESSEWTNVSNFIDSDADSKHFISQLDDNKICKITFGNGVSGKIPKSVSNGLSCSYRLGYGKEGNVGTNTIVYIPNRLSFIKSTFNPYTAYIKGSDREDVEVSRIKAPAQLGLRWGAISLEDFRNLALGCKDVIRTTALRGSKNVINIYYYSTNEIYTDEQLEQLIQDLYIEKKLLTATIRVFKGTQRPITIRIDAKTYLNRYNAETKKEIEDTVRKTFRAGKFNFQETPLSSDFYQDIMKLDSVLGANILLSNEKELLSTEIPVLGDVIVNVEGGM